MTYKQQIDQLTERMNEKERLYERSMRMAKKRSDQIKRLQNRIDRLTKSDKKFSPPETK